MNFKRFILEIAHFTVKYMYITVKYKYIAYARVIPVVRLSEQLLRVLHLQSVTRLSHYLHV